MTANMVRSHGQLADSTSLVLPRTRDDLNTSKKPTLIPRAKISQRLVEGPELRRDVVISDYHDPEHRGFEFNIGDVISVREISYPSWFGVNLRTNTYGRFPPCYGISTALGIPAPTFDEDREKGANADTKVTEAPCVVVTKLVRSFQEQYPDESEPVVAFDTIRSLRSISWEEYWLYFRLAYPQVASSSYQIEEAYTLLRNLCFVWRSNVSRDYVPPSVENFVSTSDSWKHNWSNLGRSFPLDCNGQWTEWELNRERIKSTTSTLSDALEVFKEEPVTIPDSGERVDNMVAQYEQLVFLLNAGIEKIPTSTKEQLCLAARTTREEERQEFDADIKMGLSKTASWSSAVGESMKASDTRYRNSQMHPAVSQASTSPPVPLSTSDPPLLYHRLIKSIEEGSAKYFQAFQNSRELISKTPIVISTVILLSIASIITTALAAWECSPAVSTPNFDSNFWSTISGAAVGIASLYCTWIPLLLSQAVGVDNELLFCFFLISSLVTAVAAVGVYPYQGRASMALLAASGLAQLGSTLQIIFGILEQVKRQQARIARQEDRIAEQSDEIEQLEARLR